jgi:hypothetical protein
MLANQECCSYISHYKDEKIAEDRKNAGRVMLTLMEGVEPEDNSFSLQNPHLWSESANKFLSSLTSHSYEESIAVSSDHS